MTMTNGKRKPRRLKTGLTNLRGRTFGFLEVIQKMQSKQARWKCKCTAVGCGKIIIVPHYCLIRNNPKTHCGCQSGGLPKKYKREYHSWWDARARTCNPKHPSYPFYGAKGIKMCIRWQESFQNFLEDMGPVPKGYTLDRKNAFGNYEPDNCRWANDITQARNKKGTKYVIHPKTGQRIKAAELTDEYKCTYQALRTWMLEKGLWYDPQRFKNQKEALDSQRQTYSRSISTNTV